jgi:hypothetical protein
MDSNPFLVKINSGHDNVIGAMYDNYIGDALGLRQYLIDTLNEKGVDYKKFNKSGRTEPSVIENPPKEIYEYQLFFLLKRKDGTYSLLDGFRRLLWYNTPKCFINVRVYDEVSLTDHQIMKLLVYFNHLKFYGSIGNYYDRGFALGMKTLFDLNILTYDKVFDSYLSTNNTVKKYWMDSITSDTHIDRVKNRMLNPFFVSDMKFIEALSKTPVMMNDVFGALVFQFRVNFLDKEFDLNFFNEKVKENSFIGELHTKFAKNGDGHSVKQQDIINELIKFYTNIFNEMFGVEVKKTYTEILTETKALSAEIKKDKRFMKLSGSQKSWLFEWAIKKRLYDKKPITFKCVIHPSKNNPYEMIHLSDKEKIVRLKPGLVDAEIKVTKVSEKLFKQKFEIGFTYDGVLFTMRNTEYHPAFKKADGNYPSNMSYDIDLFVDITPEEIEWVDKNRNRDWGVEI